MTEETVKVRIVGNTAAQLALLAGGGVALLALVAWRRRKLYVPLAATKTARAMRRWATRIEDTGLAVARTREDSAHG